MGITMKKALALVMALLLALPGFVLAEDDAMAVELDAGLLASNDGLELADGLDLTLDGLSLDLVGGEGPLDGIELDITDPEGQEVEIEGGGEEEAGKPEASEAEEPEVEVEGDVEGAGETVPEAQPLLPPDWAVEGALEGETDEGMMANALDENSTWGDLNTEFHSYASEITLNKDYIAGESDERLSQSTPSALTLNLNNFTIDRNRSYSVGNGNVIYFEEDLTINGPGTIKGGNNEVYGGGIGIDDGSTLTLNDGAVITGNRVVSTNAVGLGGGVYLAASDEKNLPNKLIMNDSTISLNEATSGGGVDVDYFAEMEMNAGATISDNKANDSGGGVVLLKNSTFKMKGGEITGNTAKYGGGVFLFSGSQFEMNDGKITNNTAKCGGGVFVESNAIFNVSGKPVITGNTVDKKANNVYLKSGAVINVTGAFESGAKIGVSMANRENSGVPISFTTGLKDNNPNLEHPSEVFFSDDENYGVDWSKNGKEAVLKQRIKYSAKDYTGFYDGKSHGITVTLTDPKDAEIKYGTDKSNCNKSSLTYTDVGQHTVYYKISANDYATVTGSATVTVNPKTVALDWSGSDKYTYSGEKQGPDAKLTKDSIVGTEEVGVTVKYKAKGEGDDKLSAEKPVVPGSYVAVAVGLTGDNKGNYKLPDDNLTMEFTIAAKPIDGDGSGSGDQGGIAMTLDPTSYVYDGTAKMPAVTVKDGDKALTEDVDYTVQKPSGRTDVGDYTVTVSGKGNYTGKRTAQFSITAAKMTVSAEGYTGAYDGAAHGITVTVNTPSTGSTVKYGESESACDKDSSPTYTEAGTYTVYYKVTADNYEAVTGSAKVEITAKTPDGDGSGDNPGGNPDGKPDGDGSGDNPGGNPDGDPGKDSDGQKIDAVVELNTTAYTYDGQAKEPKVTVKRKDNGEVVPKGAYTVSYSDNVYAGTAKATVADVAGDEYNVSGEASFTIAPKTVGLYWSNTEFTYDTQPHAPTATATGLVEGDTCDVTVGGAQTDVGRYIASATGLSNPNYALPENVEHDFAIYARVLSRDQGNVKIVVSQKELPYNGLPLTPGITLKTRRIVTNAAKEQPLEAIVPEDQYRVTYYNNVYPGTATVRVRNVPGSNYIIDASDTFTIIPRKVTVTAADQSVKVGGSIKTGVGEAKLTGQVKGHVLKSVKLVADSTERATQKGKITPSGAKIADARGNDVTKYYNIRYAAGKLTVTGNDAPKPKKSDYTLLAEMKTCGHSALRISWTPVAGAEGYEVTFAKNDGSLKNGKRVSVAGGRTVKLTNLKRKTAYKAYVRAWKIEGKKLVYIGKASPVVCAVTGDANRKWTNAGSVSVKTASVTLAVGKQAAVRATVKGVKSGKKPMRLDGAELRWYSSNAGVATVKDGVITAVAKGECAVYAMAANGKRAAVKVKVK